MLGTNKVVVVVVVVVVVSSSELRWCVTYRYDRVYGKINSYLVIFISFRSSIVMKKARANVCWFSLDNQSPQIAKVSF